MDRLDIDDGFDVHDHRDGLKVLERSETTWHLENREGYACPACGRSFERLFVSAERTITFGSAPNDPICVARTPDQTLVVAH